ncbi:MAG: glycosyltransferase family 2 protein [bacterium]
MSEGSIAVVIPCYKVLAQIDQVLAGIGTQVARIYVVDDACPERTGEHVQQTATDPRVKVLFHEENKGVGGAMVTGYKAALAGGATIVVKLDGDNQMDPAQLDRFVLPIQQGRADYTKGNRFFSPDLLQQMPRLRLVGNGVLSLVNKVTSGYWDIMDPTNGYTAIHATALRALPLDEMEQGYFFECEMLFRLNIVRAVVVDIPLVALYGDEVSNLRPARTALEFPFKYLKRFFKRIGYNYFLRDFNAGTFMFTVGLLMSTAGASLGSWFWYVAGSSGVETSTGQVMLASLPILLGSQLLVFAVNYDISNIPREPMHKQLNLPLPPAEKNGQS